MYLSQQFPSVTSVFANIRNPRRKSSALFSEGSGYLVYCGVQRRHGRRGTLPVVPLTLIDIPTTGCVIGGVGVPPVMTLVRSGWLLNPLIIVIYVTRFQ